MPKYSSSCPALKLVDLNCEYSIAIILESTKQEAAHIKILFAEVIGVVQDLGYINTSCTQCLEKLLASKKCAFLMFKFLLH